jgi:hypothetical protein
MSGLREKKQVLKDDGACYEIICTQRGEVGVVYDIGLPDQLRENVRHIIDDNGIGSPTDTALSILAHHFGVNPKRAFAAAFGVPQSVEEEFLAQLYPGFLHEIIEPEQFNLPPNSTVRLPSDRIRTWCNQKLKDGSIRW